MPPRKKATARAKGGAPLEPLPDNSRARTLARATLPGVSREPIESQAYTLTKPHDVDEEHLADEKSRSRRGYKAGTRSWREDHDNPSSSNPQLSQDFQEKGSWSADVQQCTTTIFEETQEAVGKWKQRSTEQEGKALAVLSQTYPSSRPHQSSVGDARARPELYTVGTRVMQRCHQLLELYREFNTQLADDSNDVDDPQWLHDAERMSEILDRGNQFGKELVDAMVQPVLQPRLPMVDAENAKDTNLMAIEMFDGVEALLDDTWGRTARMHLDAFETLLSKEANHL